MFKKDDFQMLGCPIFLLRYSISSTLSAIESLDGDTETKLGL